MKKKVHEQVWPTLLLAAAGFGLLMVAMPEWARAGVAIFGAVFIALVAIIDDDVRHALLRTLDACLRRHDEVKRRDDAKSKPAKQPSARRAAT